MNISPLSSNLIAKLAALNFEQIYKAWINQEKLVFTYINENAVKNPTIHMLYNENEEHNEYEYYCTNLPGCVISESDGEEAFNKMIWGIIECLDCRYSLNKINNQIYLTGYVYHMKSYICDLTQATIETLLLEQKLVDLGYEKIYPGITVNIYFKRGSFSTLCIPNNHIKPLIPLDLYYTFLKLTNEMSKKEWINRYG